MVSRLSLSASPAGFSLELGMRQFSRELWHDARGRQVFFGEGVVMTDSDGLTKSVKGFRFELRVLWASAGRNLLELSLPYYNQEFSPYVPSQVFPNALDDSSVRRADASGDLELSYRRLLVQGDLGHAGAGLIVSAPTGQGPFSSSHPLVATGTGGFRAALALDCGLRLWGASLWLSGSLPYDFGYNADIAPGTFVGYSDTGSIRSLPGGRALVTRGLSAEASLGLGADWFSSATARHRVALELQYLRNGETRLDGAEVPESASESLCFVPQARFAFASGLAVNFGWIMPFGRWAANTALAYAGEYLLRADYKL